jgi:CheY-like chemotaxis protein
MPKTPVTPPLVGSYDIQFGGFDKLMPFRIREVLLVAAPYDSFLLADDDALTELVFSEYLDLNLRYAPRVTRVATAAEALKRLGSERFDLVITMASVGNLDVAGFAREAKRLVPDLPVILLCFNMMDVAQLAEEDKAAVDRVFVWLGDPRIFMSIIKLVEDQRNIDHDIGLSSVQAIIVVEDSVRFYSSYLPVLYAEFMKQTQLLMAEGINLSHKMLRMRARPKILLAHDFESAWALYEKYQGNLLGVITDIQFMHEGKEDPRAGLVLAERVKAQIPDMPVLVQSSDASKSKAAEAVGASFLHKTSANLLKQLQDFILKYFGFGDFVFHDAAGREHGRASDLHGMIEALKAAPDSAVEFHANRNHFSKWLMARTEFEIAYRIRPRKVAEFKNIGELRRFLIETMHRFLQKTQLGTIIQFDGRYFDEESPFVKIGRGSIGGKARGLAFVNFLLSKTDLAQRFEGVRITVPHTSVISTDVFDFFMEHSGLNIFVRAEHTNAELAEAFLKAELPGYVISDLRTIVGKIHGPLAVRSSSMLEDSRAQPFAGVYKTYMLPNSHPDMEERVRQLGRAVKLVYASTYSVEARSYLRFSTHLPDEEKMAVIVQHLVGRPRGEDGRRYYPNFSGVAQSYNYYPVPPIAAEDGVAYVALGLGKTIMDGYRSLRFSPKHPHHLHQFSTVNDYLANSQREFLALDTRRSADDLGYEHEPNMTWLGLDAAEADRTLSPVGSTYSAENAAVYDGTSRPGTRLVTFAPILKDDVFPLPAVLNCITRMGMEAMGSHVEIEFAVNLDRGEDGLQEFAILQMRPMISRWSTQKVKLEGEPGQSVLCQSPRTLGNGYVHNVTDVVYVKPERFEAARTVEIAGEIGRINEALKSEGRQCLLIGPGRWGSADPWLGIPVRWNQISESRVIVETTLQDFVIDPSYGTHFFHNVTSLGLGYFTVRPQPAWRRVSALGLARRPARGRRDRAAAPCAAGQAARHPHRRLHRPRGHPHPLSVSGAGEPADAPGQFKRLTRFGDLEPGRREEISRPISRKDENRSRDRVTRPQFDMECRAYGGGRGGGDPEPRHERGRQAGAADAAIERPAQQGEFDPAREAGRNGEPGHAPARRDAEPVRAGNGAQIP